MKKTYDTYGIAPERIAGVLGFAIDLPDDTVVNEFTVGPANQPWLGGRGGHSGAPDVTAGHLTASVSAVIRYR